MNVGMLWLDGEKTSNFPVMVANAAIYYKKKYGQSPNLCFVHPSMLEAAGQFKDAVNIAVKSDRSILPGLLWIGVDDQLSAGAG